MHTLFIYSSLVLLELLNVSEGASVALKLECTKSGLFAQGCGPEVVICGGNGYQFSLLCPHGLWFDEATSSCILPAAVATCFFSTFTPTTSSHELPNSYCAGFDDGFFPATSCSSSVVRCLDGVATLFECPHGKFFTPAGCWENRPPQCEVLPTNDDCVLEGKHNVGRCSPLYILCESGASRILSCPWPLVFDISHQTCEYDCDVAGCPSKSTALCPSDGIHAYGSCSSTFYSCFLEHITPMYCPMELVFDPYRKVCVFPTAFAQCATNGNFAPEVDDPTDRFSFNKEYCVNRADDFYALGCSSTLIGCVGGTPRLLHCPTPLVFDERKMFCDEKENVDECEEERSLKKRRRRDENTNRHPPSGNMFHWIKCDSMEPRVYQIDCEGNFFYCISEMGFEMHCLHGFLYSEEEKACVSPDEYGECHTEERP